MRTVLLSLSAFCLSLLPACDKNAPEPPLPESATVTLAFNNLVNGQPLTYSSKQYQNAAGNTFSVELLKYYVTNAALLRADGSAFLLHNYDLIDAADPASCQITAAEVPNGDYVALRFFLGVDSARNHTGLQEGDLDPVHGMTWNWNTGYIFFKHEGRFTNAAGADQGLVLHFGTDLALTTVEVPLPGGLSVQGAARKVFLNFDLGKLYASPHTIDFNEDNFRQSITADDRIWLSHMKENFLGAFEVERIE